MRKAKVHLTKHILYELYYNQGKTLQNIGDMYGVTREYIRQKMAKFQIPRIKKHYTQEELRFNRRQRYWRIRIASLKILGGKCRKCGETDIRVLQINHKNGLGRKGLREQGDKFHFDITNGTRDINDLEILCANCNILYEYERGNRSCIAFDKKGLMI